MNTMAPPTYPDLPPPPTFVPSAEAVEAVAESLVSKLAGTPWHDLEPVARNHFCHLALSAINAAGPLLVTSALTHVTNNHAAYGFSETLRDELTFAAMATGATVTEADDVSYPPSDPPVT